MMKILIYSKMSVGSGNCTTAHRISLALKENARISYRQLSTLRSDQLAHEKGELKNQIESEGIDLVIGINAYLAGTILIDPLFSKTKFILIASGTDINEQKDDLEHEFILNEAIRKSKGIWAVSKALAGEIQKRFKVHCDILEIPPSIDEIDRNFNSAKLLKARKDGRNVVLPAGIRPVKDILFAIECFLKAHEKYQDDSLLIIGPVIDQAYYQEVLRKLKGNISIVGPIPRSSYLQLLTETDLLINTSKSEGLSNAIMEAFALGVPVLTRDIEGNRALVTQNRNGHLFSDIESFVSEYGRARVSSLTISEARETYENLLLESNFHFLEFGKKLALL